jgi:hypothetical protein
MIGKAKGEVSMRNGFALLFFAASAAIWAALACRAVADSYSEREHICNNACFHRTGDVATVCFSHCKSEKRAGVKTGPFRTTGGNYPGLERR